MQSPQHTLSVYTQTMQPNLTQLERLTMIDMERILKIIEDKQEELEAYENEEYLDGWADGVQEVFNVLEAGMYQALEHLQKVH